MARLHNITNENILIQEKVNYCADYYAFLVDKLGVMRDFEIENILSVIEKIIHLLENNKDVSRNQNLMHYLSNPLIQSDNKYFQQYKNSEFLYELFDDCKKSKTEDWLNKNELNFIKCLKKFKTYLKRYMFRFALNEIISYLSCSHDLIEHKEDLEYYIKLIAVELYYERNGKEDIRSIFDKLMTKDIHRFPFDRDFEKRNADNINHEKIKFIKNRTFHQQFLGIKNFWKQPAESYYYIFRIGNIRSIENFELKVKGVEFYNILNPKIQKIKRSLEEKTENFSTDFFDEQFTLYAIVSYKTKTREKPHIKPLENAMLWLEHINKNCDASAFIDRRSYLFTKDFINIGYNIHFGVPARMLNETSISKLHTALPFEFLKSKKLKSKEHFFLFEKMFIKAHNSTEVHEYWHYVESLLRRPLKNRFISIISKDLLKSEIQQVNRYIINCISPGNITSVIPGLSIIEQRDLVKEMVTNKSFDFELLKKKINNNFITELVKYRKRLISENDRDEYLNRLINEIQEQRNFVVHSGKSNNKSDLKLKESIPLVFAIFRRKVIEGMIKYPNLEFDQVIEAMTEG